MNVSDDYVRPLSLSANNPYSPALPVQESSEDDSNHGKKSYEGPPIPPSLTRLWIRWTIVCGIAAAPSFFIAYSAKQHSLLAMTLGTLCFIIAYVSLDHLTFPKAWRHQKFVRRMLVFSYGTRIVVSMIYPMGLTIDLLTGFCSYHIVSVLTGLSNSEIEKNIPTFGVTFLLTIVQGLLLNLLLAAWCLLCSLIVMIVLFLVRLIRSPFDNSLDAPSTESPSL